MQTLDMFISEGDRQKGLELVKTAQLTPVIFLTSQSAIEDDSAASHAWRRVHDFIAKMAVKHDMEIDDGPYGINFETGQFVQ